MGLFIPQQGSVSKFAASTSIKRGSRFNGDCPFVVSVSSSVLLCTRVQNGSTGSITAQVGPCRFERVQEDGASSAPEFKTGPRVRSQRKLARVGSNVSKSRRLHFCGSSNCDWNVKMGIP